MSNAELQQEVKSLQTEVERLKGMVLLLRREKFGSKSERFENADQLIFNEIEFLSGTLPDTSGESETETVSYKRAKPGRGKKKSFPENLPREERVFDLTENEKTCPHDGSAAHRDW
jgi:transposase